MNEIKKQVQNVLHFYSVENISALQQHLYVLYLNFNKVGGGKYIINYPNKDELAECFTLMLKYDWINDNDIREVWAENGFYCIIEYLTVQANTPIDKATAGLDLFILLCEAREFIKPKIQNILNKAVILRNPIFQDHYINNNADCLINQILYLSAKLTGPLLSINQNILQDNYKIIYNTILSNEDVEKQSSPYHILEKAKFISTVIGSILNDM